MKGISNTQFAPQDYYTKDQAIATFLRLYKIRDWEEQNHLAKYKKISQSKKERVASLIKDDTEYISTIVDNEYGQCRFRRFPTTAPYVTPNWCII